MGHFHSLEPGEIVSRAVRRVKRYEFEDEWKNQTISDSEIRQMLNRGVETTTAFIDQIFEFLVGSLLLSPDVPKIEIEPTEWEVHIAGKGSAPPELRVREGVHFGAIEAVKSIVGILRILLNTVGVTTITRIPQEIERLVNIMPRFSDTERLVYEAVYTHCASLAIVNYDIKRLSEPGATGYLGGYTETIIRDLAGQLDGVKVTETLYELEKRKVLSLRRHRWYISP
ncbi:hypothetical protein OIE67_53300 [Nonomuraea fuscirosea]|uniref:hypothetical protein n=1 Tax=Nonomuraea fuscirosea TaxID=1291556 RepID=UPI002DDBAFF6|nr:hypothetical protein [Nonomuraea fuscirosea]WSA52697.1 hypothetical protein OIE67_53300 [Nonomuraea fuscirosea]